MDRHKLLQSYISKEWRGLEIGPLHSGICPKREGWNTLIVDFMSSAKLRQAYLGDPNVDTDLIEEVDIITGASLFQAVEASLKCSDAKINYIISSHNFEHQPDPVRFLMDCERLLDHGGILLMAIPIASRCFDCWQPLTTTGTLFDAFLEQRQQPTPGAILDQALGSAVISIGDIQESVNDATYSFSKIQLPGLMSLDWVRARLKGEKLPYCDTHVSRFNPHSFELILHDLSAMGLLNSLIIDEISVNGLEFIVRLIKMTPQERSGCFDPEKRTALAAKSIAFQARDLMGKRFTLG